MFFEWLLDRSFVELVSIIPLRNYLEDKMEDCMIYICSIKHYFDIYITFDIAFKNRIKFNRTIFGGIKNKYTEPRRNYFIDFVVFIFLND